MIKHRNKTIDSITIIGLWNASGFIVVFERCQREHCQQDPSTVVILLMATTRVWIELSTDLIKITLPWL